MTLTNADNPNDVNTQLKNLLSATDIAAIFVNQNLQIFSLTPAISTITTLTHVDIGRSIEEVALNIGYKELVDDIKEVLGTSSSKENEVQSVNGKYYRISIHPYLTTDDKIEGVVITFTDLSEKKRQEAELDTYQTHLEQLKRVQEAGKVGYWAVHIGKEYLEWSVQTYKMFDIPYGNRITYDDLLSYIYPEDKEWVDQMWQKALKSGEYAVVYRIKSAEQKIKWIETFGDVVFDADGKFVRALGIVRDITEQKETEIKLAALASSLKHSQKIGYLGSWVLEATSPYIEMNEEAQLMFGRSADQPMTVDDWLSTIHLDDRDRVWKLWTQAMQGAEAYDIEYKINVNGSIKWIKSYGEMSFNANGEFARAVGVVKDISKHTIQQENLRLAKEEAEAATKLKSEFLANMSHEIRTPLNGIIGFSDLLIKTNLDDTQKQYMATVHQSAHSLFGIINNVLDFSKIEAGKLELVEDKLDLFELVDKVKNIVSYLAKKKNIDVRVKVESNVPRYVLSDGLRIHQVLTNLMSNAVKFTQVGEVELSIKLLKSAPPSAKVFRFAVRDTGIGISPENQQKIFEAFTQEDISTTKKFGGTGLGLSISNGILAIMESHLQLEGEKGKGSLFYFDVTLKDFEEDHHYSNTSKISKVGKDNVEKDSTSESPAIKVLLVEDNLINIMLFRILILEAIPEAVILEAHDGKKAVKLFESDKPKLILMDIQMPIMNGLDATKRIREIEHDTLSIDNKSQQTPIIALTASTMEGDVDESREAGMNDFIGKPINVELFKTIVKKWGAPATKTN